MSAAKTPMALSWKLKLVRALARVLTGNEFKVAYALILYFHNSQTGKCFPSYRLLAEESGTSAPTAVTAVKKLKTLGVVGFDPSNGGRNQRNSYNIDVQAAERLMEEVFGEPNTKFQPAEQGVQPTEHKGSPSRNAYISEDTNEGNNEGKHNNARSARTSMQPDKLRQQQEFDEWYEAYPRHVGRGQALKAYSDARKKVAREILLAGAKRAAKEYADTDKQYIPHPKTWLNGERWLDEDTPKPKTKEQRMIEEIYRGLR